MANEKTVMIIFSVLLLAIVAIVAYFIVRLILSVATRPIDDKIIHSYKGKTRRGRKKKDEE